MSKKNPYVLKWNVEGLKLSNGSTEQLFYDHEEAMDALEKEVHKCLLPFASEVIKMGHDHHEYYRLAELEVVREERGKLMLYGVSPFFLRPKHHFSEEVRKYNLQKYGYAR